jgi:putative tryptophan/tyrosine transport system substrate-binding protein
MRRRQFFAVVGGVAAWPLAARAQRSGKMPVVGTIWHGGGEKEEDPWFGYQRQAFEAVGFVSGKNIIFEDRYASEIPERFDAVAAELVALGADVIIANNLVSTKAAQRATSTIPIVFMVADPVRMGVVPSLAHPGGNATGLSYMNFELDQKRLQLFKDAVPGLSRLALLVHADARYFAELDIAEYGAAAKQQDITIDIFQGRNAEELKAAFSKMAQGHFDGLIVGTYPLYDINSRIIAELALDARLPTMTTSTVFPDAGALLSYSAPLPEIYKAAAVLVRRILGGEKPAELPVQQPTKLQIVLNMKTANALGLNIPAQFLARVDRVID